MRISGLELLLEIAQVDSKIIFEHFPGKFVIVHAQLIIRAKRVVEREEKTTNT